jgi:hypothetical protein
MLGDYCTIVDTAANACDTIETIDSIDNIMIAQIIGDFSSFGYETDSDSLRNNIFRFNNSEDMLCCLVNVADAL